MGDQNIGGGCLNECLTFPELIALISMQKVAVAEVQAVEISVLSASRQIVAILASILLTSPYSSS